MDQRLRQIVSWGGSAGGVVGVEVGSGQGNGGGGGGGGREKGARFWGHPPRSGH